MLSNKPVELSIVISFKNEENSILELHSRIHESLKNISYEVIFVDDCSSDKSGELLSNLTLKYKNVFCIRMTRTFGTAECLIAGIVHSKGKYIAYLDADLQDPPELLPQMYSTAIERNADIINMRRTTRLGEPAFKMFLTKIGYKYLNKFGSVKFVAEVGDFKLISRRAALAFTNLKEVNPFPRGMINYLGYPEVTLDYTRQPRYDGIENSKFKIMSNQWLNSHLDRTLISFSDAPLKILFYFGIITLLFTTVGIFASIGLKITNHAIPGWTSIIILLSFSMSLQSIFLGIIGLYISNIFLQVKNRPLYIIDSFTKNGKTRKLNE